MKMHYLSQLYKQTLQNGHLANLAGFIFIYVILIGLHDATMLNYITSGV